MKYMINFRVSIFNIVAYIIILILFTLISFLINLLVNFIDKFLQIGRLVTNIIRISLSQLFIHEEGLQNSIDTHIIDTHEDNSNKGTEYETSNGGQQRTVKSIAESSVPGAQ